MSMVFIYCCSCTCRPTDEAGGLMGYFGKALSPSSYLPVHVSRLPSMTTETLSCSQCALTAVAGFQS